MLLGISLRNHKQPLRCVLALRSSIPFLKAMGQSMPLIWFYVKRCYRFNPCLNDMQLIDYRVRILHANDGSGAMPRVLIESIDIPTQERWSTIGYRRISSMRLLVLWWIALPINCYENRSLCSQSSREQVQVTRHHS